VSDTLVRLAALKEAFRGEALFRPSSIGRVIACPGSVSLCAAARQAGHARFSSKYALEGSAAHVVAEQALKGIRQPDEWTDRMVRLDSGGTHGHFVDAEMVEAVGEYVDEVRSGLTPDDELFIEHRMSLAPLDPGDPILGENRGTGDAVILNRKMRKVKLKDLKYGKGVMVSAETPQLKDYAVQLIVSHPETVWDEVELVISQPRAVDERQRLKSIIYDPVVLMTDFLGELMQAMHESLRPDPPLKTGSHCRWCDAKDAGLCPAIRAEALNVGRDSFEMLPALTAASRMGPIPEAIHLGTIEEPYPPKGPPGSTVSLPPAAMMGAADVATVLDRLHLFEIWASSVKERACSLIEAGVTVPGWMLSARTGHRRWKGEEPEVADALRAIGVKTIEMYTTPKLLSPAQVEKKLKKEAKALLEPLIERPLGEPTLMRATEPRAAVASGRMGAIES
jgi:Protein of unknown function (DUF2800)